MLSTATAIRVVSCSRQLESIPGIIGYGVSVWAIVYHYDSLMFYQGNSAWIVSIIVYIATGIKGIESQRMRLIGSVVGGLCAAERLSPDIKAISHRIVSFCLIRDVKNVTLFTPTKSS